MTKKGVLICSGLGKYKNLGDFVQSIAAKQFVGKENIYVERENLKNVKDPERIKCIMNAWFMQKPETFPPSDSVIPLFLSFHLNPLIKKNVLTEENIQYFKQYQPIGCRDLSTVKIFQDVGVEAYFSGCLTLTLGETYKSEKRSNKVYFVDPFVYDIFNRRSVNASYVLKYLKCYLKYKKEIKLIAQKVSERSIRRKTKFDNLLYATKIFHLYGNSFSLELLTSGEYIEQVVPQTLFKSEEDKFVMADKLLKEFADAKYVVTSRIHTALPCLAFDTPVVFISHDGLFNTKKATRPIGRLEGLAELFRVLYVRGTELYTEDEILKEIKVFTPNLSFENKKDHLKLRDSLLEKAKAFFND